MLHEFLPLRGTADDTLQQRRTKRKAYAMFLGHRYTPIGVYQVWPLMRDCHTVRCGIL